MRKLALIALTALPVSLFAPVVAFAAPPTTVAQASPAAHADMKAAVQKALQSANLTPEQKLKIAPMLQNYQKTTAGADTATKQAAGKTLMKNVYGVLTPDQQTKFKASMKSSMASMPGM